ncbi:DUF3859 domain-containing protein [Psychromarinibacter halotolerans]|uniref:DUF3859 domain-containing protein n=1 Tax=Psychromarinibacter halotolerans TaxID=1775175 RepID=A0ABV7GWR2_9RHOB|nr:DUF3859 domain-containing protein [Psychromarinibacter halotolerans]MDF0598791.1 DUF3859 domain-containing protein [Psychromarinibacter halotolerans]
MTRLARIAPQGARRIAGWLLFVCALALLPANGVAADTRTPGAAEFTAGYFCAREPVDIGEAEGTVSGTVSFVEGLPPFLGPGPLVPGQKDVGFGVHVRALPDYAGPVEITIEHPPMGPNNVTSQTWYTDISGLEAQYYGYTFDYEYEILKGQWRMTARTAAGVVYSAGFEVVDPALLPPVTCGYAVPLS